MSSTGAIVRLSLRDAAKAVGLPLGRVRSWLRQGLIPDTGAQGLGFRELLAIRRGLSLWARGLSSAAIGRLVALGARRVGRETATLADLSLAIEGRDVVVADDVHRIEVRTGQLLLDFGGEAELRPLPADMLVLASRWNDRGVDALDAGDRTLAEAHFRRALGYVDGFREAIVNLSALLVEQGEYDEAREQIEHAFGRADLREDVDLLYVYARMFLLRGDGQSARVVLERLCAQTEEVSTPSLTQARQTLQSLREHGCDEDA